MRKALTSIVLLAGLVILLPAPTFPQASKKAAEKTAGKKSGKKADPQTPAPDPEKPQEASPKDGKGSPGPKGGEGEEFDPNEQEFEKLKVQFEAEKGKEDYERVVTVERFGEFPTKKTVPYIHNLIQSEKDRPGIVAAALKALGRIGTRDAIQALMQAAPLLMGNINIGALASALSHPMESDAEEWLLRTGIPDALRKDPEAVKMLVEAMARLKSEKRVVFLQNELKRAGTLALKVIILHAFRDAKPKDAARIVAPFLKDTEPPVLVAVLQVLLAVEAKNHAREYVALLKSGDWQVRAMAVELVGMCRPTDMVRVLEPLLEDPEMRVRIGVVDAFAAAGGDGVVMPLIRALGKTEGRVLDDIADALARLTGKNFGSNPAQWESWWASNKGKAKIQRRSAEEFARLKEGDASQKTAVYFGLRVISKNIAFVIDCSGSMTEPYVPVGDRKEGPSSAEPGKTTSDPEKEREKAREQAAKDEEKSKVPKIVVAKRELLKVLDTLPTGVKVNIIRFNSTVEAWKPALTVLDVNSKKGAVTFVNAANPEGMTNVFGALEEAFKDEKLDTIYFLSDGAPTIGSFIETEDIIRELEKVNQLRKVKIHTIGFNLKPEERRLMELLAEDNYGVFLSR